MYVLIWGDVKWRQANSIGVWIKWLPVMRRFLMAKKLKSEALE
jgi:hypothetical protein